MKYRHLWLMGGMAAVLLTVSHRDTTTAQEMPIPFFGGGQVGRFVVARADKDYIIILDTTSGKLYKATEKDFQKFSDLPKVEGMKFPLPFPGPKDRAKDKTPPPLTDKGPVKDTAKAPIKDKTPPPPDKVEKKEKDDSPEPLLPIKGAKKDKAKSDEDARLRDELRKREAELEAARRQAEEALAQARAERDRAEAARREALAAEQKAREEAERRKKDEQKKKD